MVTGSRSLDGREDRKRVWARLDCLPRDVVVLHGRCLAGADWQAFNWATARQRPQLCYPARWKELGDQAGFARNQVMVGLCPELVLAFWDGKSRGTRDAIDKARKAGINVEVNQP